MLEATSPLSIREVLTPPVSYVMVPASHLKVQVFEGIEKLVAHSEKRADFFVQRASSPSPNCCSHGPALELASR